VRVSAPASGHDLPVVLFAHGFGSSPHAYGPLTGFWAGPGFVVVQPELLDSRTGDLAPGDPRRALRRRHRVADLARALDHLAGLAAAVPGLSGCLDTGRVAASFGGQTAAVLAGLRVGTRGGGGVADLPDPRVRAAVLPATAGAGGDALGPGSPSGSRGWRPPTSRTSPSRRWWSGGTPTRAR
jgi:dienelactone hydrolase